MPDGAPRRAWKRPPRHAVRVSARDGGWDVRPGPNGEVYGFASEDAALRCAHELARRAWADHDRLSCVLRFVDETWHVEAVFGVVAPPGHVQWMQLARAG